MRLSQLRFRRYAFMIFGKHPRKSPAKTLYELLGARPDADAKILHRAFRDAARVHHPDRNPDDPDATRRFAQIVNAYGILRNAEQRQAYDGLLALESERRRARLMRTVSGAVAVVVISAVMVGGFAVLVQRSNTWVETAKVVELAARKVANMTAVQPTIRTETANRDQPGAATTDTRPQDEPGGKSTGAEPAAAPNAVAPEAKSHEPLMMAKDEAPDRTEPNSEVAEAVDALVAAVDRGDMGKSKLTKAVDALVAAIDRGDMGKSKLTKAVDALTAAIDRGDMGKSKLTKAVDALTAAIDRGDMGKSKLTKAVDALVAAIDRGDMRSVDDQKKNDEPHALDQTRVGSAEPRSSSADKHKSPSSDLAIVDEKHEVSTTARLHGHAKRPVTGRTTVGQATTDIRRRSQVALASQNTATCAGSCSDRAPPLFGVGF
jgi:DnaJ domain